MTYPSDIETTILDSIHQSMNDYNQLNRAIDVLYNSFPEYPVLKFFFLKTTRLNLSEKEARILFDNVIRHCGGLSTKIGNNINYYVGFLDYIVERNRIIMNPIFIDLYIADDIEKTVYKDPLTNVFNQHYLPVLFKMEINRANRRKSGFAVMLIDIDKFSLINNNYGYNVGNQILIEIAQRISQTIRGDDTIIRYFDDRFIVFMPNTTLDGARMLAERVMSILLTNLIRIENKILNVTLSIGIVEYPRHCSDHQGIIEKLNKLRYKCKENGGNHIAVPPEQNQE